MKKTIEKTIIHLEDGDDGFNFKLEGTTHELSFLLATICSLNSDFESIVKLTTKMLNDKEVMQEVSEYAKELLTVASEEKKRMN